MLCACAHASFVGTLGKTLLEGIWVRFLVHSTHPYEHLEQPVIATMQLCRLNSSIGDDQYTYIKCPMVLTCDQMKRASPYICHFYFLLVAASASFNLNIHAQWIWLQDTSPICDGSNIGNFKMFGRQPSPSIFVNVHLLRDIGFHTCPTPIDFSLEKDFLPQ